MTATALVDATASVRVLATAAAHHSDGAVVQLLEDAGVEAAQVAPEAALHAGEHDGRHGPELPPHHGRVRVAGDVPADHTSQPASHRGQRQQHVRVLAVGGAVVVVGWCVCLTL